MKNYLFKRVFLIVMDSVGIGAAPDAKDFGDEGTHTLGSIAKRLNGLEIPNLERLGLGCIRPIKGVHPVSDPVASYGAMQEASIGKDTMTGHWEIMGLNVKKPFRVFPDGFPEELLHELREATGRGILGNKVASGTEILDELGKKHVETGDLIVYTSADSVLQIAVHEDVVPIDELYTICAKAREITLRPEYMVGRVIARPFVGDTTGWKRTANRHDYALKPFGKTVMNELQEEGLSSIALGKISDIYDGEGVTEAIRTESNEDGINKILTELNKDFTGLCFLNLVDFDALYGHRRDVRGYGKAIIDFDKRLDEVLPEIGEKDLLIITADHGNDPTHTGTDHTREIVPLLVYSKNGQAKELGVRETFADLGATIADNFNINLPAYGKSFLKSLEKDQ